MLYLIQKNVFKETNYDKIFEALDRLGLEYEIIDCLPFVNDLEFETERKDVFLFGSVKMARLGAKNNFHPGSFYGGNHDFNIYKEHYKENLLNYGSIVQNYEDVIQWNSPYDVKFMRPCRDTKIFTGGLFTKIKWEDKITAIKAYEETNSFSFDGLIQINEPQVIYKEARIWIVDGKIVTSSYYHFKHNVEWSEYVDQEGLDFAQSMIDLYQVAEAFVMDICLTPDGWKIVEINCINCAGFYQGDLQKIIIALEDKYNPA